MLNVCALNQNFKNPIIAASGTFGFGREFNEYFNISKLGGIATKGLTINEKQGNLGRRIHETASGLMNSIGLQNPGIDSFLKNDWPFLKALDTITLANLGGASIDDYVLGAVKLKDLPIIELNISCPNVKEGGIAFGIRCNIAFEVVSKVRQVYKNQLVVKLSPQAENIRKMAEACVKAGADGISLVNTFNALAIDVNNMKPIFNNTTAGLSGPAIKPIALRMVYEVANTVNVPIIGIGGILTAYDALEFIMAGASLVQVGSANLVDPMASIDIINGIHSFMQSKGIKCLDEIRGIIGRK